MIKKAIGYMLLGLALLKEYSPDRQIKILHAGPNSQNGSDPFIWYVIAEVRASSRTDGSALGRNGCDAPGSYFLQTKEGWQSRDSPPLPRIGRRVRVGGFVNNP